MHQIEAGLNRVDGRDRTPPDQRPKLLFWGRFVGSDRTQNRARGLRLGALSSQRRTRLRLGQPALRHYMRTPKSNLSLLFLRP